MALWTRARAFWRTIVHRADMEQHLSDEVRFHLERRAADLMARDHLSADEAYRRARLEFGSIEKYKEQTRQSVGLRLVDELRGDVRYALRRLTRDWRFATAAVLMLGLGIGANTAIFSLVNAVLFRDQGFARPDRLVDIYQNGVNPHGLDANTYPAYLDMAEYTQIFAGTTAAFVPNGVTYENDGALRPAIVEHTTAAVDGPMVHGRRRRPSGADCRGGRLSSLGEKVPCGSVRHRPHDPHRRHSGHDCRRWSARSRCHLQSRHHY
jgi:hypothetical protein